MSIWSYRADVKDDESSYIGYDVEATDGGIGKVEEETLNVEANRLVVDTGPWILGTKRVIPIGLIKRVDRESETIHIDMTKEQVKNSPEYAEAADAEFDAMAHSAYFDSIRGV